MLPYWVLFSVFALGAVLSTGSVPSRRLGALLVIALIFAAVLIGFRYRVGGDWDNYANFYKRLSPSLTASLFVVNSDPGYGFINWLGRTFGLAIWFVNLSCASILVWGLAELAAKQPRPWVFFLIIVPYGFIVVGMGYSRQSAAIGLTSLAMSSFSDRRGRRASIYNVLAVLFHKSCIFMLPLIALADRNKRLINSLLAVMLVGLLYYSFISESKELLIENYLGHPMQSSGAGVRILMTLLPALIFLYFQRRLGFNDLEISLWRNLSYAAVASAVALLLVPSSTVVDRLTLYLIPFQAVIWSRIPWALSKKGLETSATFALVAYSAGVLYVWLNFGVNAIWWLPYRFFPIFPSWG
jgi:hypothetical protein